jgi:hypothetical protein
MSSDAVEYIHVRLREEIDRCGMSLAAASRAAQESSPQRLKDVVSGRQKCTADLIARLIPLGVDSHYVLTGQRPAGAITSEEIRLLELFRAAPQPVQNAVTRALYTEETASNPGQTFEGNVGQVAQGDINNQQGVTFDMRQRKNKH